MLQGLRRQCNCTATPSLPRVRRQTDLILSPVRNNSRPPRKVPGHGLVGRAMCRTSPTCGRQGRSLSSKTSRSGTWSGKRERVACRSTHRLGSREPDSRRVRGNAGTAVGAAAGFRGSGAGLSLTRFPSGYDCSEDRLLLLLRVGILARRTAADDVVHEVAGAAENRERVRKLPDGNTVRHDSRIQCAPFRRRAAPGGTVRSRGHCRPPAPDRAQAEADGRRCCR